MEVRDDLYEGEDVSPTGMEDEAPFTAVEGLPLTESSGVPDWKYFRNHPSFKAKSAEEKLNILDNWKSQWAEEKYDPDEFSENPGEEQIRLTRFITGVEAARAQYIHHPEYDEDEALEFQTRRNTLPIEEAIAQRWEGISGKVRATADTDRVVKSLRT